MALKQPQEYCRCTLHGIYIYLQLLNTVYIFNLIIVVFFLFFSLLAPYDAECQSHSLPSVIAFDDIIAKLY